MQNVEYVALDIAPVLNTNGEIIGIDDTIVKGIIPH